MDDSSNSDEELQEAIALAGPGTYVENVQKVHVCNNTGLLAKLEEFQLQGNWIERLDVSCEAAPAPPGSELDFDPKEVDPKDDFKRELLFYRMAQSAAATGLAKLKKLGVPTKRPDDFLAEMVKSDDHMARVRANLVARQHDLQTREKAKALRQQKKFAKQSQVEAQLRKHEERRHFNDALKKMKKTGGGDIEGVLGASTAGKRKPRQSLEDAPMLGTAKARRRSNKKRDYKNDKFGFGGQKKRTKYNTKESARTFTGFNTAKHGATTQKAAKINKQQTMGRNKNKARGGRR